MRRELAGLLAQFLCFALIFQTAGIAEAASLRAAERRAAPHAESAASIEAGTGAGAGIWEEVAGRGAEALASVRGLLRETAGRAGGWALELSPPRLAATGGGSGGSSAAVDLTQVPLLPGANLISLPNPPADPDPAAVLAPIAGQFTKAFAYDACDAADPWKVYDPADPAGSDLAAIDHTLGVWIDATATTTLPTPGTQPATTQQQLCTGWNLIGYPLAQERPVPSALASIAGKYARVFGFELADGADPWEVFDVAVPDWANDVRVMTPGRGYWVLVTEDVLLDYANEGTAPEVEIASPAARAEVASIQDVLGSVRSNLLDTWTLSYRASGASNAGDPFVPFATGDTPVESAFLGAFDPTLLLNGMYDLKLEARDFQGQIVETVVPVAVDGLRKVGLFTLSFSDLRVQLSGLDLELVRTYDSRDKKKRDFGVGWTLDIRQGTYENNIVPGDGWEIVASQPPSPFPCVGGVETKSHMTTIRLSDQEVYRFRLEVFDTGPNLGGCFGKVRFAYVDGPVPGATLAILGNTDVLWSSGTDFLVDPITVDVYNPTDVRLRTRDGREFDFVLGQGVTQARDTNGNELQITPTSISHSSGLSIAMARDAQGRVTSITDPAGTDRVYQYDAAGDLVAFTDPAGNTTTFTYDDDHGLLEIFDPLGNRAVRSEYDDGGRLISTTDAAGNTISFARDLAARREVVTDRLGFNRVFEYDERGNVTRTIDELGNETLRTYDGEDNLLSQTDPLGRTTTFTYTADNDLASSTDPLGNVTTFTYDAAGRPLKTTDPRGNTTTNVYDAAGNLTQTTDALGNTTTFTYDARGNALSTTDPLGNVSTATYDSRGNLASQTDPLGNTTTYSYDAKGNQLLETRTRTIPGTGGGPPTAESLVTTVVYDELDRQISITSPDGSVILQTYDSLGRVISRTDGLGRKVTSTYDARGRLVRTEYPDGSSDGTVYDAEGRALTRTDRAGRVVSLAYDATGRLLTSTQPGGDSTTSVYDAAGQMLERVDERGNSTTYVYDAAGRRTQVVDALGNATTTTYDAAGNPQSSTDALGNTTLFTYDAMNRRTLVTLADGQTLATAYDALGRRISETDQAGRTTTFGYDAAGRLTSVTDALGQVTSYTYDEVGNRLTQTDANGNTTTFGYDAAGRQISRTLPDGATESRSYNPDGTVATQTDFLGRSTTFAYDLDSQLVQRDHPDGTAVTWAYTPTGRKASYTDFRGTTLFGYDLRDRLTSMTTPDGRSLTYAYDAFGNRTSLTATVGPTVLTTSYTYDALNRLATVTDPSGGVYTHGYDLVGNRATLTYPNAVETTTLYDPLHRLTSLSTTTAVGQVLQGYDFTLDVTGRRTRIDEADAAGPTRTLEYTYDSLYRLTRERATDASAGLIFQEDFAYDPVGNRTSLTRDEGAGPSTTAYAYDARDRISSEGATTYGWDANGNLVSKSGVASYAWNTRDQLTTATLADGTTVVTTYDPDGNRVRTETTPPGGSPVTVDYLVDTTGFLSHVVVESDGAGNVLTHYTRGDELLSLWRPALSERRYFHADGIGSVRLLTDPSAAVTDSYTYTAFGVLEAHAGSDSQPYRFTGEPIDPNTSFQYHRARWLDVGVGRFVSQDPFSGSLQDPTSLHRYLYAAADPVGRTDPTGLTSTLNVTAAITIIGLVSSIIVGFLFYSLTLKYLPPDPFSSILPDAAFIGFQAEGSLHLLQPWLRHPVAQAVILGLRFVSGFTGIEFVMPRSMDRLWAFWVTGVAIGNPKDRAAPFDFYGGGVYGLSGPGDYGGFSFCTNLRVPKFQRVLGVCASTNETTHSWTLGRFEKYGKLISSAVWGYFLGEIPLPWYEFGGPPAYFPGTPDQVSAWIDEYVFAR